MKRIVCLILAVVVLLSALTYYPTNVSNLIKFSQSRFHFFLRVYARYGTNALILSAIRQE